MGPSPVSDMSSVNLSLELIWFLSAFCRPFLDPNDVSLPNVPFRLPWSRWSTVPGIALWLAPVPLVDYRSCSLTFALGFADRFTLDISLTGEGRSWRSNVDGAAGSFGLDEALTATVNFNALCSWNVESGR